MNYLECISLIDKKDRKGWEYLYLQYGRKFYGFAISNWGFDTDEAWDIVYQTLQTVILKIGDYEIASQEHFDNLLFKIFTNYLRQQYRKKKSAWGEVEVLLYSEIEKVSEGMVEMADPEIPFDARFFDDYLNEREVGDSPLLKELKKALLQLDPFEQELLLLRANNYTYEQIARMLKVEGEQLKVKHFRAKNKLIKLLQPKQK